MKHLLAFAALLASPALAAPLLGTTNSFFDSAFCRAYRCSLSSREPIAANIVDFRYTLAPEETRAANEVPAVGPTFSVIRVRNVVTSLGFETGAQDSVLYPGGYLARVLAAAVAFVTGTTVTPAALFRLEQQCDRANGRPATLKVGAFTVSCVNSFGEYENARRVAFRVYR